MDNIKTSSGLVAERKRIQKFVSDYGDYLRSVFMAAVLAPIVCLALFWQVTPCIYITVAVCVVAVVFSIIELIYAGRDMRSPICRNNEAEAAAQIIAESGLVSGDHFRLKFRLGKWQGSGNTEDSIVWDPYILIEGNSKDLSKILYRNWPKKVYRYFEVTDRMGKNSCRGDLPSDSVLTEPGPQLTDVGAALEKAKQTETGDEHGLGCLFVCVCLIVIVGLGGTFLTVRFLGLL